MKATRSRSCKETGRLTNARHSRFRVCEKVRRPSLRQLERRRNGAAKDNGHTIIPRHSRESGNPEATVRNVGPVFLTETPQRDSRIRGNDECL